MITIQKSIGRKYQDLNLKMGRATQTTRRALRYQKKHSKTELDKLFLDADEGDHGIEDMDAIYTFEMMYGHFDEDWCDD